MTDQRTIDSIRDDFRAQFSVEICLTDDEIMYHMTTQSFRNNTEAMSYFYDRHVEKEMSTAQSIAQSTHQAVSQEFPVGTDDGSASAEPSNSQMLDVGRILADMPVGELAFLAAFTNFYFSTVEDMDEESLSDHLTILQHLGATEHMMMAYSVLIRTAWREDA